MGSKTAIAWTDATFNPVWGCTKVSDGCNNCYAAKWAGRFGVQWGPHGEFRQFGDKHWNEPLRWNREAAKVGQRTRVFCASMGDVFDNRWPDGVRERLWALIRATPWLQWQLLTKRPQNIAKMLPPDWGHGFFNVWIGTTVENQAEADRRIPHLLMVPATVRFLSCEPLIGPVQLNLDGIDWVIVGGESGGGARPMQRVWAESILRQCEAANVAAFFKQVGGRRGLDWPASITGKGDDPAQWPGVSFVQQFPAEAL